MGHAQTWHFLSDEDEGFQEDVAKIEQTARGVPKEAAEASVRTVLDAVHADLRYPDAVTPSPERGSDTVLDATHTLMEGAKAGEEKGR